MTLLEMIKEYDSMSYTHEYIFGFEQNGSIYAIVCNASVLPIVTKLDKASRNGGYSLRFKPNRKQKEFLMASGKMITITTKENFDTLFKNTKYNRGEIFEKLVNEYFGKEWKKDNIPFTKKGDIEINDISYQIKFTKATFINEQQIARLNKSC